MNASLRRWKILRNQMVSGTKQDNLLTIDQSGKRWLRRGKRRIVLGIAFQGYSCAESSGEWTYSTAVLKSSQLVFPSRNSQLFDPPDASYGSPSLCTSGSQRIT